MATIKGIGGIVMLGTDAVLEIQSFSFSRSAEETDTSIINANAKRTETGAVETSGSISAYLEPNDTTGQEALESALNNNTTVALNMYIQPNQTGNVYYSCNAVVTSIEVDNGGATGRVTRNFSWKSTDALVRNTVA